MGGIESAASMQEERTHSEAPSHSRSARGKSQSPRASEEPVGRSHFEAFHRNYAQFDYPPQQSRAKHTMLSIAGMFLLTLSALAIAAWMNPPLMQEGVALLKTASAAVGLEFPGVMRKTGGAPPGTSQGELPYDGNTTPATTPDIADSSVKPSEPVLSGGNSTTPNSDAGGSATDMQITSAPPKEDKVAKLDEVSPTPVPEPETAPASDTKPSSSAKPRSKETAVFHAARKREISRLRRQAEDELYAQ